MAADPAREALSRSDAYVSPAALDGDTADAAERLRQEAADLRAAGRPVELAIVAGPAGAPTMLTYARRLRTALGTDATLVVTAPGRAVAAVGPLSPAEATRRLRAVRAGAVEDPVERVIAAARAAAPTVEDVEDGHPVLVLLALAGLGGVWAAAIATKREQRRRHEIVLAARAEVRARLDGLEARLRALAEEPDLSDEARALFERALGRCAATGAALQRTTAADGVHALEGEVAAGLRVTRDL